MRFGRYCAAVLLLTAFCLFAGQAIAAQPLVTDEAKTLGKRHFQYELGGAYGINKEQGVTTTSTTALFAATFGIDDTKDYRIGAPYSNVKVKVGGSESKVDGLGDVTLSLKWRVYERFFEKGVFRMAVKPVFSFPTGDHRKGLGEGRFTAGAGILASADLKPVTVHANLGYVRNEKRLNMWRASLAMEYQATKDMKLVVDTGIERAPSSAQKNPAYALGGLVYSMEGTELALGYRRGLVKPKTDDTVLVGVTLKL